MTLDRPDTPVKTYQVWRGISFLRPRDIELIDASSSFEARKVFAKKHSLEVTDVAARRLDLGIVQR